MNRYILHHNVDKEWSNHSTEVLGMDVITCDVQKAYWSYRAIVLMKDETLELEDKINILANELRDYIYHDSFDNIQFMTEVLHFNTLTVNFYEIAEVVFELAEKLAPKFRGN